MIDVTVMVWHLFLFGYLYVCVIIVEGSRRAGINRMYIVADSCLCGHLYLIRVVACGDLCKRFTCMVVHTCSST